MLYMSPDTVKAARGYRGARNPDAVVGGERGDDVPAPNNAPLVRVPAEMVDQGEGGGGAWSGPCAGSIDARVANPLGS
jgi:hypothetical protein